MAQTVTCGTVPKPGPLTGIKVCRHCGNVSSKDPTLDLSGINLEARRVGNAPIGEKQVAILRALIEHPHGVTREQLADAVFGDDPTGGPEAVDNVIAVQIVQLRKKLAPFGIGILPVGRAYRRLSRLEEYETCGYWSQLSLQRNARKRKRA